MLILYYCNGSVYAGRGMCSLPKQKPGLEQEPHHAKSQVLGVLTYLYIYICIYSLYTYIYNIIYWGGERARGRENIYVQILRTIIVYLCIDISISMYRYHAGMDPAKWDGTESRIWMIPGYELPGTDGGGGELCHHPRARVTSHSLHITKTAGLSSLSIFSLTIFHSSPVASLSFSNLFYPTPQLRSLLDLSRPFLHTISNDPTWISDSKALVTVLVPKLNLVYVLKRCQWVAKF